LISVTIAPSANSPVIERITMLDQSLLRWLDERADALDTETGQADALVLRLALGNLFRAGVPAADGGSGESPSAAIGIVAELAQRSMSAAFVFWAQRAFIECVLASPNRTLVQRLMPALLQGRLAGAPGLSNGMKFMGGLDRLQTEYTPVPHGFRLNGRVPWATNLHRQGFVVALVAGDARGGNPAVFAVPHHANGLRREPDMDLVGLRSTNTAALRLDGALLDDAWQLHPDARTFLPAIRPAFVGLQCGLGLGLARASLRSARRALEGGGSVLGDELATLDAAVHDYWRQLSSGIDGGRLRDSPLELLELRIRMVELAIEAVQLELQALGGRAYLRGDGNGFARRWREAAFLPLVTPTLAQLKTELGRAHGAA
jgi:alkylation response protein AidB-like acyl-CoA dehydrogenase